MWVVKLGGSLLGSDRLRAWLDVIGCYGVGNAVVVPGGGVFADQVRATQQHWGFDDGAAHHMALLAMEQYGVLMSALRPDLALARSRDAIRAALERAEVPVWLPRDMVLADAGLPACWDLTSDSLAAWLARVLGADRLLLVKSAGLEPAEIDCATVARTDVVDPLFCTYARDAGLESWLCAPDADADFRQALHSDTGCGTRLMPEAAATASSGIR